MYISFDIVVTTVSNHVTNIEQISGVGTIFGKKNSVFQLFSTIGAKSWENSNNHFSLKINKLMAFYRQ